MSCMMLNNYSSRLSLSSRFFSDVLPFFLGEAGVYGGFRAIDRTIATAVLMRKIIVE